MRKVKLLTPRQAKAYMVLALRNIKRSPNEISEQEMWDEMETVMSVYDTKEVIQKIAGINDSFRIKQYKI